jgi:hypothetical protein
LKKNSFVVNAGKIFILTSSPISSFFSRLNHSIIAPSLLSILPPMKEKVPSKSASPFLLHSKTLCPSCE